MAARIAAHVIRQIAVESGRDPRTVARVLAGRPTRPQAAEQILRAAANHGILPNQAEASAQRAEQIVRGKVF